MVTLFRREKTAPDCPRRRSGRRSGASDFWAADQQKSRPKGRLENLPGSSGV